jgi:hypothetical protein
MKERSIFVHLGVLALAAAFAIGVWTRDKKAASLSSQSDVTVWPGRPADVERIAFEGKKKKVSLEAKEDKAGRYFVGSAEREAPAPAPADHAGHDAPEPAAKSSSFVSVGGSATSAPASSASTTRTGP